MAIKNQKGVQTKKATSQPTNTESEAKNDGLVFGWDNYKWMLAGVLIIVLGFVLMAGGGSDNPAEFNYDEIFSWRRIGLAPMMVLAGFGVVGYSIMRKKK